MESLNPYCSGQWSRTLEKMLKQDINEAVLILIVVDNGLVPINCNRVLAMLAPVLILIVVDNGLVQTLKCRKARS